VWATAFIGIKAKALANNNHAKLSNEIDLKRFQRISRYTLEPRKGKMGNQGYKIGKKLPHCVIDE